MLGSNVTAGWVGQDKAGHPTGWLLAHTSSKPERKLLSVPTAMLKAKSVAHFFLESALLVACMGKTR